MLVADAARSQCRDWFADFEGGLMGQLIQFDAATKCEHVSQLSFCRITRERFASGNSQWHRTLPEIGALNTMRICFGAMVDGELVAVAAWSNPVARMIDQVSVMELRRFAIGPAAPRDTASWMMSRMARHIRDLFPKVETLISYSNDDEHHGTIYKASNWTGKPVGIGGPWNNQRGNRTAERLPNKTRWELKIRKQ